MKNQIATISLDRNRVIKRVAACTAHSFEGHERAWQCYQFMIFFFNFLNFKHMVKNDFVRL